MEATGIPETSETTAGSGASAARSGRGRAWGVRGLVALGSILLILGTVGVWIQRVVFDTPTWTNTSSKVLQDPDVQVALSTYLVDQLYANVDIAGQLESALPPRAKPLAAPAAAGLRNVLQESAQRALASPQVQRVWRTANRTTNRQLIHLLNDGSGALTTTNGAVVLDLRALVSQIAGQSAVADRVGSLPPNAGRIVILRSGQLKSAQTGAHLLDVIAVVLVPLVALIFALAIWLAEDRRKAVRACALGVTVAGLLLVFVRRMLGHWFIDRLVTNDAIRPAAHDVWWIVTGQLGLAITSILFVGVVGVVGSWVAGHGRRATALRCVLAPSLRDDRCWWAFAAVVLLLLVWAPTPAARNWITVLVLLVMGVVGFEALRRVTAAEFPAVETDDATPALPRIFGRGEPAVAASADDQRLDRLGRLAKLHADGVLDDAEFSSEKAKILAGSPS